MHNTLWIAALAVLGAGILAIELGISSAITEILAGVVVGSVLDFQPGQYLESLASLGILTLMYVAGLEIDLDLMRSRFRESVSIGFSSFTLPFISVAIIARYALHFTSMHNGKRRRNNQTT
ncbi:MAG: cation:proton antiporter [Methanobacteriota archaeon]